MHVEDGADPHGDGAVGHERAAAGCGETEVQPPLYGNRPTSAQQGDPVWHGRCGPVNVLQAPAAEGQREWRLILHSNQTQCALVEGPHRVTPLGSDSLIHKLEAAYGRHTAHRRTPQRRRSTDLHLYRRAPGVVPAIGLLGGRRLREGPILTDDRRHLPQGSNLCGLTFVITASVVAAGARLPITSPPVYRV
jgi:hypothetical protein